MNTFAKFSTYAVMASTVLALGACSDNDDPQPGGNDGNQTLSAKEAALKLIVADYVDNSVVPTYRGLADAAIKLSDMCDAMCDEGVDNLTAAKVAAAGQQWIEARRYWELSEAWLYGAAADYDIDPHIDTWPLDKTAMEKMLGNPAQMEQMKDRESAANYVGNNLGQGLLGFHAIEYMLFEPADASTATTSPRPISRFTQNELYYLAAVANDLRNQCVRLEAAWADEGATSAAKMQILADAELDGISFYGEELKAAGGAGSRYHSYAEAVQAVIVGAQDIADEVGGQKIGNPIGSVIEADPDYIESPYALNSITDFVDNIRSVRHAYMGYQAFGSEVETYIKPCDHTLSSFIAGFNPELDTKVRTAIDDAIAAISLMQEPFASTSQQSAYAAVNTKAVEACANLNDVLDEVIEAVQNY